MITPDVTGTSPNYSPASWWWERRAVIIHSTRSGIAGNDDWTSTLNWFARSDSHASSHWLVGRDGRTARIVPDIYPAWHAGDHNVYAFGIELEQPTIDTPFTDTQLVKAAEIVKDYALTYNIPATHISGLLQGEWGVIGHDETEGGKEHGKSDPGPMFPWEEFMEMINTDVTFGASNAALWAAIENLQDDNAALWAAIESLRKALRGQAREITAEVGN